MRYTLASTDLLFKFVPLRKGASTMKVRNFSLTLAFVLGFLKNSSAQRQTLNLYKDVSTCDAPFLEGTYHNSTFNVATTDIKSASIHGLWQIGLCGAGTDACRNGEYQTYLANQQICVPLFPNIIWTNRQMHLVRLGDENMNSVELHLYLAPDFNTSTTAQVVRQNGWSSPFSVLVRSYFFMGSNRWRLYEGRDFTGNSICLSPSEEVEATGSGITMSPEMEFWVQSVKYSCDDPSSAHVVSFSALVISIGFLASTVGLFCNQE